MLILITMFGMGCLLGFVGAGGAGVVIAVLVTVFGIPIHMALGTSLGAMAFTTLSGAYSHFREGNVIPRVGIAMGLFGAVGAFAGAKISASLSGSLMHWLTAAMLFISAGLIYMKVFFPNGGIFSYVRATTVMEGKRFWVMAILAGAVNGLLSGTFGIGATAFIQLTLLFCFGLRLRQSVGTTMLVILPIAIMGGIGYLTSGFMDLRLFVEVVVGLMGGAYIGAKGTRRLPLVVLKIAMVAVPVLGGLLLMVGNLN